MNIIKPGDLSKVNSTVKHFVCTACGCEWEADDTEYFSEWSTHDIPTVCQCPTCNSVVRDHMREDGSSILTGYRIEMCRTCENWQKGSQDYAFSRCIHNYNCTHYGFKLYKQCARHTLD